MFELQGLAIHSPWPYIVHILYKVGTSSFDPFGPDFSIAVPPQIFSVMIVYDRTLKRESSPPFQGDVPNAQCRDIDHHLQKNLKCQTLANPFL